MSWSDRSEFWRSVGVSTVLLTDGVLRAGSSRLALRYDATQDDALWEVRWARRAVGGTEENAGGGYALRPRRPAGPMGTPGPTPRPG